MSTKVPRGIRNHNPGNIRRSDDPWQGLADRQTDRDFFVFRSAVYGIRALARVLIAYQDRYGLRTIQDIINRWAPPTENNTQSYVASVARAADFAADQQLDMHQFDNIKPVVVAIIQHENGKQPYSDAEITKGLVLAGVEPPQKDLQSSRTVRAGKLATGGTLTIGVVEAIQQSILPARDTLTMLMPYLDAAKWVLLALTLIGIGTMIWARIDDHRRGLR